MTYEIDEEEGSIKCLNCGLTSYNPKDVAFKYCGNCHIFHDDEIIKYPSGRAMYYALDRDFNPCPCGRNQFAWQLGDYDAQQHTRQMCDTNIDGIRISTVFLSLDHGFSGGTPILFETMIFGDIPLDNYQWRYCTYKEAVMGHYEAVEEVEATLALLNQADNLLKQSNDELHNPKS